MTLPPGLVTDLADTTPQVTYDVGAYTGTTSPYGEFDMGGNVFQWNEALISGSFRGLRGGSFVSNSDVLQSSNRSNLYPPARDRRYRISRGNRP